MNTLLPKPLPVAAVLAQARAHLHADRYRAGRECLLSVSINSDFATVQEYVRLLNALGEAQRTLEILREADRSNWPVSWLLECAMTASTFGDQPLARAMAAEAVRRETANAAAHHVLATLNIFSGDISAAVEDLERAVALAPGYAPAYWALAQIGVADAARVERIRTQLAQTAVGSEAEVYLQFALHHELHKLGRYDEAWVALERGCGVKRQRVPYDRDATHALFQDLIARCTSEFCASASPVIADAAPVFIVGMHRAGTTLLEGLLAGHPQIADLGENYTLTAQLRLAADHYCVGALDRTIVARAAAIDFTAVGNGYLEQSLWRAQHKPFFTEKLPSNFLNVGFIAKALPRARFLHLVRDARDVCFSNLRMLYSHVNGYSYTQDELADFHRGYRRLMAHWHSVLPGRVLDVSYRDLITDTERVIRDICEFLGLSFAASMMLPDVNREVTTASAAQIRGGLRPPGKPAWEPYTEKLQPLFRAIEE